MCDDSAYVCDISAFFSETTGEDKFVWLADSGASLHITFCRNSFIELRPVVTQVELDFDHQGQSELEAAVELRPVVQQQADERIAAQEALKKDREPVKGRLMFVSQYAVDRQHRANPASMFAKTLEKTKLFVKGLPISVTEDDLKRIFGQHATPKAVRLVTFKTGKSRGFAYVEFSTEEEARKVLEMLDGTELQGHKISVAFSDPSFRRQEDSSDNLGAHSRSLAGGDSRTNKPTWHPRTQVSFVPRVLQMAPGKPPTFSSNHSDADNPTSSEGKVLSNADFRQIHTVTLSQAILTNHLGEGSGEWKTFGIRGEYSLFGKSSASRKLIAVNSDALSHLIKGCSIMSFRLPSTV
uniref:RRM domain-containing protein n=1 Tax=Timema cristinae TaxID=61476 RepID=A0A7R9CHT8_TIMCR|nr:unnamed protein product [Timema cristinae]